MSRNPPSCTASRTYRMRRHTFFVLNTPRRRAETRLTHRGGQKVLTRPFSGSASVSAERSVTSSGRPPPDPTSDSTRGLHFDFQRSESSSLPISSLLRSRLTPFTHALITLAPHQTTAMSAPPHVQLTAAQLAKQAERKAAKLAKRAAAAANGNAGMNEQELARRRILKRQWVETNSSEKKRRAKVTTWNVSCPRKVLCNCEGAWSDLDS